MRTYDAQTIESTGTFMVGELERLDPSLHLPLHNVTWNRDIDLREDVVISDEASSFTNSEFAAAGGAKTTGKNWVNAESGAIPSIAMKVGKTVLPMNLWALQLGFTIIELEKARQVGRPIDVQKLEGLRIKHNMDVDEQVYIGDTDKGITGLVNNADITPGSITTEWDDEDTTAKMILDDINGFLEATWLQTAYSACPERLLLPPRKFALLTKPVSEAGTKSILQYVAENSLSNSTNGRPLEIHPCKWLTGRGAAGKDRMVAYTKSQQYVRFPLVPLQRTPIEFRGLSQLCTYYGALGEVEFVYGETVGYADGL